MYAHTPVFRLSSLRFLMARIGGRLVNGEETGAAPETLTGDQRGLNRNQD